MSWIFRMVMPVDWREKVEPRWGVGVGVWAGDHELANNWFWSIPIGTAPRAFKFVRGVASKTGSDYESLSIQETELPDAWTRIEVVAVISRRERFGLIPGVTADVVVDGTRCLSIDLADDYEAEYGVCLARILRQGVHWEVNLDGTGFHLSS